MFTAPRPPSTAIATARPALPVPAPRKIKTHADGGTEIRVSLLVHGPQKDQDGNVIEIPKSGGQAAIFAKHVHIHVIDAEAVRTAAAEQDGVFDLVTLIAFAEEECNDADKIEITPENVGRFITGLQTEPAGNVDRDRTR